MIGLYCILNLVNGKVYIGQSIDVDRRLKAHINKLKGSRHFNDHLQNAFDKYGIGNFVFSSLLECTEDKLDYSEVKYISDFDATNPEKGYNLESGGNTNKHLSSETKAKKSKKMIGANNPKWDTSKFEEYGGLEFIKEKIAEGWTQKQITEYCGLGKSSIRGYLNHRGTSWAELGGNPHKLSVIDKFGGLDFLKSEIKKGKFMREVAKELSISHTAIRGYLERRDTSWTALQEE